MNAPAPSAQPMPPLNVLVVDDTATNRQILSVFLKKLGHKIDMAEDGAKAVERFAENFYDLVIMDVMMPVMDGYEATRRIKAICADRWVPVIFLSALDKDENLVTGLDAGGDDYMPKPINFTILEAKLRAFSRTILLRREVEEARRVLQAYHDEREAENLLAAEILEQLMQRPGLSDPALHYWMNPASNFSGDIVAAARSADGRYYVLLADATGHGLAAAISVLPLMTLFYDVVEFGLPVGRLIAKINGQLRAALPVGRFVCCALLCLDPKTGHNELWMGGMPNALLIDANGGLIREITSANLPMGIDDIDWRQTSTEAFATPDGGGQVILYSDGLIEAQNATGEPFGLDRLVAACVGVPPQERLNAIKGSIHRHMEHLSPHDDVTLLVVDLPTATRA